MFIPGRARMRTNGDVWELYIPTSPVPASRPRVGRWGTYYSKTYQTWMRTVDDLLRPLKKNAAPTGEIIHVSIHMACTKPRTGELSHPRGDLDNYVKAACDAVTRSELIWLDDRQVVTEQATKRYAIADEEAHTFIRASLTMAGVWLPDPLRGLGEDVYDLPPSMRVPLDLLLDGGDGEGAK